MENLNILVCENYMLDFKKVLEILNYNDVSISQYPCLCGRNSNKRDVQNIIQQSDTKGDGTIVLCSSYCGILKLNSPKSGNYKTYTVDYCFSHLAYKQFIEYIIEKGGYIISPGWLKGWHNNLDKMGFDRKVGQAFYKGFCTELVYLDSGSYIKAEDKLKGLSDYLGIPYKIIHIELETLQYYLKSIICEWRLHKESKENAESTKELRNQNSEYAAILNIMEQISIAENQREVIEKLKTVFLSIFGAQKCNYWTTKSDMSQYPKDIIDTIDNPKMMHCLSKCKSEFLVKLEYDNELLGVLEVGDFLFPEHCEKYLNLSIAVVKVSALVLSNVKKYELLIKSKNELEYISFHDSLTGLYNRSYFNKISNEQFYTLPVAVFICDIDGLKTVNDKLGHAEGDRLICKAADILEQNFRETDVIARIGGDEFVVIVSDCDVKMAEMLYNRINQAIIKSNENNDVQLGISIGYAVSDNQSNIESLIKKADKLMYKRKAKKCSP